MSGDASKIINIWTVDNRDSFRRGDNHPRLIYLYTVLRWAVNGTFIQEQVDDAEQIIRNNDSALASVQALLADGIESGSVAVFNVHSGLAIGHIEKESLVSCLRTMDVKNDLSGLVGAGGLDYFLDGKKLCRFIKENLATTDDDFQKGELWLNLIRETPSEWHTHTEPDNDDGDWITKSQAIAQKLGEKQLVATGAQQVTARNICEAVQAELAKDSTTHGRQGPRSVHSVRTVGLKGWKFCPPKRVKKVD